VNLGIPERIIQTDKGLGMLFIFVAVLASFRIAPGDLK